MCHAFPKPILITQTPSFLLKPVFKRFFFIGATDKCTCSWPIQPLSSIHTSPEKKKRLSSVVWDHSGPCLSTDSRLSSTLHYTHSTRRTLIQLYDCPAVFHFEDITQAFKSLYFNAGGNAEIIIYYIQFSIFFLHCHIPVSYTHLDVYKRQLPQTFSEFRV